MRKIRDVLRLRLEQAASATAALPSFQVETCSLSGGILFALGRNAHIVEAIGKNDTFISADGVLDRTGLLHATESKYSSERVRRCWRQDEHLIHHAGRTYSMTKMWGGDIDQKVPLAVQKLGVQGVACSPCE